MKIRKTRKTWVRVEALSDLVALPDRRIAYYDGGEITVPVKVR
jgi:hypothetical protein